MVLTTILVLIFTVLGLFALFLSYIRNSLGELEYTYACSKTRLAELEMANNKRSNQKLAELMENEKNYNNYLKNQIDNYRRKWYFLLELDKDNVMLTNKHSIFSPSIIEEKIKVKEIKKSKN
ncbi:MAG: hypothetical protein V8R81_05330 [Clostridia bacterium]